jgi:hypothetical protein
MSATVQLRLRIQLKLVRSLWPFRIVAPLDIATEKGQWLQRFQDHEIRIIPVDLHQILNTGRIVSVEIDREPHRALPTPF